MFGNAVSWVLEQLTRVSSLPASTPQVHLVINPSPGQAFTGIKPTVAENCSRAITNNNNMFQHGEHKSCKYVYQGVECQAGTLRHHVTSCDKSRDDVMANQRH